MEQCEANDEKPEENCSIGASKSDDPCHQLTYSRQSVLRNFQEFKESDQELLKLRVGASCTIETVCTYHEKEYLSKFTHLFGKYCCDPLSNHPQKFRKGGQIISSNFACDYPSLDLIPGKTLCIDCQKNIAEKQFNTPTVDSGDIFEPSPQLSGSLNEVCNVLGVSPPKIKKYSLEQRASAIDNKTQQIAQVIYNKLSKHINHDTTNLDCKDCKILFEKLKARMKNANSDQDRVNILSVIPSSFTYAGIQEHFEVSEHLIKKTRSLVDDFGILPKLSAKCPSNMLEVEVCNNVVQFYSKDEHSRIMPGMKDGVVVRNPDGSKQTVQKRLILCDLKELFHAFKEKFPDQKIGFSKFAELRPKNCILAGANGTHTVCVCVYHQNAKLLIAAIGSQRSYLDFIQLMVCDTESEHCMLSGCEKCPGLGVVREILVDELCGDEDADEKEIIFKQWVSTDNCQLITCILSLEEFIQKLCESLKSLKVHHYVAKKQSQFLKLQKEFLQEDKVIVLGDFAENYSSTVQDEVQSWHWSGQQTTLHPFVIYWREECELKTSSFCYISDHLVHNTVTFYTFQRNLMERLKSRHPQMKKVSYFTDGSGAQYKNRSNFANLLFHEQDYQVSADWHFYATSHGKGPCDGIGGVVKRKVRKASLQRPVSDQILTPLDVYNYCSSNIKGIEFAFCSKEEVKEVEVALQERFRHAQPIPQTRSYHSFKPVDTTTIEVKQISLSENTSTFKILKQQQ